MKKTNPKSGKQTLGKLIIGMALTVLALSAPLAANAGPITSQLNSNTLQRVSWGGCAGCGQ